MIYIEIFVTVKCGAGGTIVTIQALVVPVLIVP